MPAFDPVRDAVLNSPVTQTAPMLPLPSPSSTVSSPLASPSLGGRRATDLSVLLNSVTHEPALRTPPPLKSSTLSHLLHGDHDHSNDDKLDASQPLTRSSTLEQPSIARNSKNFFSSSPSPTRERESPVSRSRPSSSSSSLSLSFSSQPSITTRLPPPNPSMPPPPPPPQPVQQSTIPYSPRVRISPPTSVMIPLSPAELEMYKDFRYRGRGSTLISQARKRKRSEEPQHDPDQPPAKKLAGDVGVVVEHYNSRPDVGVVQRQESPIIGLKSFNNWVKSVLITRFAHPVLAASKSRSTNGSHGYGGGPRNAGSGKVLDIGCGKGGDMTKWAKARVKALVGLDIAAVSIDQARQRWEALRGPRFAATFAALDCYSEPVTHALSPDVLGTDPSYDDSGGDQLTGEPFDVVSMQFCMHYAFETEAKTRCMLDNVTRYLRRGGVFIGTVPNADFLLEHLDALPPDATELSFGNSVYKIRFEDRDERPTFGHKYWFYLRDAVDDVPEYVVRWDNFVQMAAEYDLYPVYKEEFHQVFAEHREHEEFGPLMVRMKVVDANGESAMDEDQWEAANIYIAFAFEKR
ncbi:putative class I-like SAM-binding methyltransferase superfamily, mRNA cap 0 methyltransferase family protein [Lyophyllum shimeji]|uniref:mRNA cap guanine-N(7) methyltransferase n=1 Tax=Lyophyllum shimeji TaxID=47721 RepID=A0A9P3UJC5_LYOSH|nr:putative class I-like SAM-binding methyltransferase superfamily, mRNA cap 0 methyltransferase family protein [Lyophyllum shimeji]